MQTLQRRGIKYELCDWLPYGGVSSGKPVHKEIKLMKIWKLLCKYVAH